MVRFRIFVLAALFLLGCHPGAYARDRDVGYPLAARQFETLPLNLKLNLQLWMTAAGYWNAVPNVSFSSRLFRAIELFQTENGFQPTGFFTKNEGIRLAVLAAPNFAMWGFRKVSHPSRPHSMWVPFGLGLMPEPNQFGINYKDAAGRVELNFTTVPNVSIEANYGALVARAESDKMLIHYKVLRRGWFVISATASTGIDSYARYHQDGNNVTGFTLSWDNSKGNVHGDRMATIMSASLRADMIGAPFVEPPDFSQPSSKATPSPQAQPATTPVTSSPPSTSSPPPANQMISTGTAIFISADGTAVTAEHVIDGCSRIVVRSDDGSISDAQLLAFDKANDLALLKVKKKPSKTGSLRVGVRLGETVEAFGFPHADLLSSSGNFTVGNVTAISGLHDDSRYLQTSAPVQAGNSGGPLLDRFGNVVGLVDAKLNALKVAMADGDLPQNVNFAIKSEIVLAFLESNRISPRIGSASGKPLAPADIADEARSISGFVACQ